MDVTINFAAAQARKYSEEVGNNRNREPKDLALSDIAEVIFLDADSKPLVDAPQLERWASSLYEKGVLFLSSLDCEVLDSAGQSIARALAEKHQYTPFVMRINGQVKELVREVDPLFKVRERDPKALVIAEALDDNAELFLQSVIKTPRSLARTADSLREIDRRLLILTNDRALMGAEKAVRFRARYSYIPYDAVPFLRPRLIKAFPEDHRRIEQEIHNQRTAGLWPEDDEVFYEQVMELLAAPEELRKRVAANRQKPPAAEPNYDGPAPSPRTPLANLALFVAAFFPRLPVEDFQRLVLALIGDRMHSMKTQVVSFDRGQGRLEEQAETKSLREIWKETYPEVLLECRLEAQAVTARAGSFAGSTSRVFIVDFTEPAWGRKVKDSFLGAHYPLLLDLVQNLRSVQPSPLFDPSSDIARGMKDLLLSTAESNPGEIQTDWLLRLLRESGSDASGAPPLAFRQGIAAAQGVIGTASELQDYRREAGGEPEPGQQDGAPQDSQPNTAAEVAEEPPKTEPPPSPPAAGAGLQNLVFSFNPKDLGQASPPSTPKVRFQDLLREMLQLPKLKEGAERFLQELLRRRRLKAFIELTWNLRDVEGFSAAKWWRRLFDEDEEWVRHLAFSQLLDLASQGDASEMLREVSSWLPKPGALSFTPSNRAALYFYIDLNALQLFNQERRRGWPPSNPVLPGRQREEDGEALLMSWLFRPELTEILAPRVEEHFERWLYLWLIPEPLLLFAVERLAACMPIMEQRWEETEKSISEQRVDAATWKALCFPAFVLADWAVELLHGEPQQPTGQALCDRLLLKLVVECDSAKCQVLSLFWMFIEEVLLDLLVCLEELRPLPQGLGPTEFQNLRRDLKSRRRCVKQLRLGMQAQRRAAKRAS